MVKVQYLGISPLDIEGFPKNIEKSFKGKALHLKPSTVYLLNEAEFEFIKKSRPELRFHVFKEEKKFVRPVKADKIELKAQPELKKTVEVKKIIKDDKKAEDKQRNKK